jgi:hypothetical protein
LAGSDAFFIELLSIFAKSTIFFGRIGSIGNIGCAGFSNRDKKEVAMVCIDTSRLKIGRPPDAGELGRSGARHRPRLGKARAEPRLPFRYLTPTKRCRAYGAWAGVFGCPAFHEPNGSWSVCSS